eukprot:122093_1
MAEIIILILHLCLDSTANREYLPTSNATKMASNGYFTDKPQNTSYYSIDANGGWAYQLDIDGVYEEDFNAFTQYQLFAAPSANNVYVHGPYSKSKDNSEYRRLTQFFQCSFEANVSVSFTLFCKGTEGPPEGIEVLILLLRIGKIWI